MSKEETAKKMEEMKKKEMKQKMAVKIALEMAKKHG